MSHLLHGVHLKSSACRFICMKARGSGTADDVILLLHPKYPLTLRRLLTASRRRRWDGSVFLNGLWQLGNVSL